MLCITNPARLVHTKLTVHGGKWDIPTKICLPLRDDHFFCYLSLPTDFLHSRTYLVTVPIPEKVDRSICPLLDNCPSSRVQAVLTPELHWLVAVFRFDHVNPTVGVPSFPGLLAVFEWTFWKRNTVSLQAWLCSAHCPGIFCHGKSVI